ncbi:MAG: HNH endonuclease [Candidatus Nitrotoga sp.]
MSATYPTKLLLAFRSGNRCAFPNCSSQLTVDAPTKGNSVVIGEAAHIAGENPTAARYDSAMSEAARNSYDNLIYLCASHHTQIDKQEAHFAVNELVQLKVDHEMKVREGMNFAFAQIGFPELQMATEWVNHFQPGEESQDFSLLPPGEKILKNDLKNGSRITITMGLSVAKLVGDFVQHEAQIDSDYPERLKAGFLEEYFRLRREGHRGDDLFDLMCDFAQRGLDVQSKRSAGLAVLVYLFEKCDVFEK